MVDFILWRISTTVEYFTFRHLEWLGSYNFLIMQWIMLFVYVIVFSVDAQILQSLWWSHWLCCDEESCNWKVARFWLCNIQRPCLRWHRLVVWSTHTWWSTGNISSVIYIYLLFIRQNMKSFLLNAIVYVCRRHREIILRGIILKLLELATSKCTTAKCAIVFTFWPEMTPASTLGRQQMA